MSSLLVPRVARARGTIGSRSVCPSVNNFYSALDLPYYWEESNETLQSERIFIVVVHLGVGFIEQRKMCP